MNIACRRRKSPLENRNLEVFIEKRECTKKRCKKTSQQKGFEPIFKNNETHFIRRKFQHCCKESQDWVSEVLKEYCQNLEEIKCWRVFFFQECCLLQKCWVWDFLFLFIFRNEKSAAAWGKRKSAAGLGLLLTWVGGGDNSISTKVTRISTSEMLLVVLVESPAAMIL